MLVLSTLVRWGAFALSRDGRASGISACRKMVGRRRRGRGAVGHGRGRGGGGGKSAGADGALRDPVPMRDARAGFSVPCHPGSPGSAPALCSARPLTAHVISLRRPTPRSKRSTSCPRTRCAHVCSARARPVSPPCMLQPRACWRATHDMRGGWRCSARGTACAQAQTPVPAESAHGVHATGGRRRARSSCMFDCVDARDSSGSCPSPASPSHPPCRSSTISRMKIFKRRRIRSKGSTGGVTGTQMMSTTNFQSSLRRSYNGTCKLLLPNDSLRSPVVECDAARLSQRSSRLQIPVWAGRQPAFFILLQKNVCY